MTNNSKDIVNAFRKSLSNRLAIREKHKTIQDLYNNMLKEIPEIVQIYCLVFKNIHPDKKEVATIKNFGADDYSDYYSKSSGLRKVFINRDGISLSDAYARHEQDKVDTKRTNYINRYNSKGFIKILKRLLEVKQEIIDGIEKEYKKSIATRFFKALEDSGINEVFDYEQDFDFYKKDVKLKIEYYDNDTIETMNVDYFQYKNASNSISVTKGSGWGGNKSLEFNDIEKCSQVFDELMAFLDDYYAHLDKQDKSLLKFIVLLKDVFARELVLNALKDNENGK